MLRGFLYAEKHKLEDRVAQAKQHAQVGEGGEGRGGDGRGGEEREGEGREGRGGEGREV